MSKQENPRDDLIKLTQEFKCRVSLMIPAAFIVSGACFALFQINQCDAMSSTQSQFNCTPNLSDISNFCLAPSDSFSCQSEINAQAKDYYLNQLFGFAATLIYMLCTTSLIAFTCVMQCTAKTMSNLFLPQPEARKNKEMESKQFSSDPSLPLLA